MPLATPQQTREIIANQPKATSEERTARARQSLAFARRETESRTGKSRSGTLPDGRERIGKP